MSRESLKLLLLKPPFGVETAMGLQGLGRIAFAVRTISRHEQDLGWIRIFNSLERPVFEKFLVLPVIKEWLRRPA